MFWRHSSVFPCPDCAILQSESSDEATSSSTDTSDADDDDDDDEREEDDANDEEKDEFDRELARMMAESGREARSAMPARRNILNERSLPTLRRQPAHTHPEEEDPLNMKFTLLMKKGAKQQVSPAGVQRDGALHADHELDSDSLDGSTSRVGPCYAHFD